MAKRPTANTTRRGAAPRAAATTAAPTYAATCHALLVYAAPAERDDTRALAIAEVAVRDAIGDGYSVQPLGPGARDFRVTPAGGAAYTSSA